MRDQADDRPPNDQPMMRVTITDRDEGISVVAPERLGPALIAALGADPTTIETLLRATDAIYVGASRLIVGALIARDRAELQARRGVVAPPTIHLGADAFAITSDEMFQLARIPTPGGLLWLDLARRMVNHRGLSWQIQPHGELRIFDGDAYVQRTVTYDVRGRWNIITLV
ncbi:MAG TPA: hypothetical protein VMV29_11450 [Ktedonobacterales bacterium]|nr:hypothetical protein [Ktedonobacterales bacterium]